MQFLLVFRPLCKPAADKNEETVLFSGYNNTALTFGKDTENGLIRRKPEIKNKQTEQDLKSFKRDPAT